MTARLVLLAAALGVAGCGSDPAATPTEQAASRAERSPAPRVAVPTADGPVELAALQGRPVVIQFAPSGDTAAWAALADALGDLEAAGATVLSVTVDGAEAQARAFGYDGVPLAVVVDGEGTIRGRGNPSSGDALFALAGPVLAEADIAETVQWRGADTLDQLTDAGGVVVSALGRVAGVEAVLQIDPDRYAAQDLPADLGTPLAFAGPDAAEYAGQAAGWGYVAVFVADDRGALTPVAAELPRGIEAPGDAKPRRRGVRG